MQNFVSFFHIFFFPLFIQHLALGTKAFKPWTEQRKGSIFCPFLEVFPLALEEKFRPQNRSGFFCARRRGLLLTGLPAFHNFFPLFCWRLKSEIWPEFLLGSQPGCICGFGSRKSKYICGWKYGQIFYLGFSLVALVGLGQGSLNIYLDEHQTFTAIFLFEEDFYRKFQMKIPIAR